MRRPTTRRSRGISLIDSLVALAILAFGMLALVKLQARSVSNATESLTRTTATQFADELLNSALVDNANFACYTLPAAGACGSATARANTDAWLTRLQAALPSADASSTYTAATQRLQVVVTWTGRESADTRRLEVTTDVR